MKINNKILVFLLLILVVSSCSSDEQTTGDKIGAPAGQEMGGDMMGGGMMGGDESFTIETKEVSDFDTDSDIEKNGKIVSNQTIDVSSQASGRISSIKVKEGDIVKAGQVLATLKDEYSSYYLSLEKAQIAYETQVINKTSQVNTLDQNISSAKISLQEAENNLAIAQQNAANDKAQAELDYKNAQIEADNSKAQAELNNKNSSLSDDSSQASIQYNKASLDYENTLKSNDQQIETYISNITKEYNNLNLSISDIIRYTDNILGVTKENEENNDTYEKYLSAKNITYKNEADDLLVELIKYQEDLESIDLNDITEDTMVEYINKFLEGYNLTYELLTKMELALNNSITSSDVLSESDLDTYKSKIDSYQSTTQSNISSFTSTKDSITSFLNTYKESEESSKKSLDLTKAQLESSQTSTNLSYDETIASIEKSLETAKISYNKALISIAESLSSYQIKYTQAKENYNNAVSNKEISILSLDNSIASAKNSLDSAKQDYAKLTISSPISGVISSIDTDENTQVSSGTNIFTISSSGNTQIEVNLSTNEITNISVGDTVEVEYLGKTYVGTVYSKSQVADDNLEFKVIINVEGSLDLIGSSATVKFNSTSSKVLLPLDVIEVTSENTGIINYYEDETAKSLEVELGKIDGSNVEIKTTLPENIQIITTDLSNYNELTQSLVVNND